MTETPTAIDWTLVVKDAIEAAIDYDVEVYGDVDPSRRWEGVPLIEIGLKTIDTRTYIDGTFRRTFNYSAFFRYQTYEEAFSESWRLGRDVIKRELGVYQRAGDLDSFTIGDCGVEPDVVDRTAGASFTGYITFKIVEPLAAF